MRLRRRLCTVAAGVAALIGSGIAPAFADGHPPMNVSFFASDGNSADWVVHGKDARLVIDNPDLTGYAGFSLHHFPTSLPTAQPKLVTTGYGVGTPRIVIETSDHTYEFIYPEASGDAPSTPWETWKADKQRQTVIAVFVVADLSKPAPYTADVTGFTYDGTAVIG